MRFPHFFISEQTNYICKKYIAMKLNTKVLLSLSLSTFIFSCKTMSPLQTTKSKQEIIETERLFAEKTKRDGVAAAFLDFADDNAVLNRNDKLVKGKSDIKKNFEHQKTKIISLTWVPDFVEVSLSGDLGYTYGEYQITYIDKEGKELTDKGIFHTVWKKQKDGKWKFVWD
jgi:ketosteroid isomerase-like protein